MNSLQSPISNLLKKQWLWLLGILLIAIFLRIPALEMLIDNDGGARAYHARLILAGEPLYGTHHTGHHLPAIYYTYATAMALFGDSAWAIQFFLLLWTLPTVYFLYKLAFELTDDWGTAVLTALFYAILSAHLQLWGQTAETELFANLFRITAVWLLVVLLKRQKPAWQFVGVGLLAAAAFLYKAVYLSPVALCTVALLLSWWQTRRQPSAGRLFWQRAVWSGAGFVGGVTAVATYFAVQSLLPRLWQVFTLVGAYSDRSSGLNEEVVTGAMRILLYPLLPLWGLAVNNAVLLLFSLAGFLLLLLKRPWRKGLLVLLPVWYLLSFVEAGLKLELFAHYYLLIVPALALLAAWFLRKLYRDLVGAGKVRLGTAVFTMLLFVAILVSLFENSKYAANYLRYQRGQQTVAQFVEMGWPGFGERLVRADELSTYVKHNSEPEDHVYYWSQDVQLYYLAERQSPVDIIWPYDLEAVQNLEALFTPQTRLVIIDERREPAPPDWFMAELSTKYQQIAHFDEQLVYERVE
ncbi:ArnT family glycosyltransferase [Candidatus Leptofilum sp.]|uniref:ArnT family glycosyltransferase n=1 Tax=Candidatus Leptofilum sp. TaxID=3241576 RepID=UPI003B5C97B5